MPYILLIVESPAKCSKIEKYLGSGYKCMASFGHITHLSSLKNIDINNNYLAKFDIIESKAQHIDKLRKAIINASETILATDDDREGEAIAWHICQVFNLPVETCKRIIFHEVTETAIKKAIREPTIINIDMVHAQQARQILDLIVGYKITPLLWNNIAVNVKTGLSAGRCQTPALRIIYDNYKEINQSPGKTVYNTSGIFTNKNLSFILTKNHDSEETITHFLKDACTFEHNISILEPKNTRKNPPSPLTTSGIQQVANNEMRISPKETMQICQKLYEGGYITYMRTDCKTYSKEFLEKAKKYIISNYGENFLSENINLLSERNKDSELNESQEPLDSKKQNKTKKNKKNESSSGGVPPAQEAHEAIRPTNINVSKLPDNFSSKEIRLYKIIWTTTVESCMAVAQYKSLTSKISAPESTDYRYTSEQVVFAGWKIVEGIEEDNKIYSYLLSLKNGPINYKKIIAKVSMKDLKSHYTEAKLVQVLEQKGIGRPSTFSSLIDKIQERNYVKKTNIEGKKIKCVDIELEANQIQKKLVEREFGNEKNKLVIQPIGILVLEFLTKYFDALFNYDYTKKMEDDLDKIAKNQRIWYELCDECNKEIQILSKDLQSSHAKESIKIDDKHTYIIGKYGPVIKCIGEKNCTSTKKGENITFLPVKKDIDMIKLQNGEYKLEEIIEEKKDSMSEKGKLLGTHNDQEVYLKTGKFGLYIQWGENKKTLKGLRIKEHDITIDNILPFLINTSIQKINDNISIRKGKCGDYIFYQTPTMKKPQFYKLFGFPGDYKTSSNRIILDWLDEKYNIS